MIVVRSVPPLVEFNFPQVWYSIFIYVCFYLWCNDYTTDKLIIRLSYFPNESFKNLSECSLFSATLLFALFQSITPSNFSQSLVEYTILSVSRYEERSDSIRDSPRFAFPNTANGLLKIIEKTQA